MSQDRERPRRWLYWVPAIVVMATIFVLSSQSGLRVSADVDVDKPFRVTGHLLAFATLSAMLLVALSSGRRPAVRHVFMALGLTIAYALTDELHQSLVPDRTGRLDDVVTDTIGALVGLAVAWAALTYAARRDEHRQQAT